MANGSNGMDWSAELGKLTKLITDNHTEMRQRTDALKEAQLRTQSDLAELSRQVRTLVFNIELFMSGLNSRISGLEVAIARQEQRITTLEKT